MLGAIRRIALLGVMAAQSVVVWADPAAWNATVGNWSDATRWSTNPLVPNNGANTYEVTLSGGTLTQDVGGGVTINSLSWSGGNLAGTQPLMVLNQVEWTDGALQNSAGLIVPTLSTLNFSGGSTQHKLANNSKITVGGTLVLAGAAELNSDAAVASGATIEVLDGGLFDIQGNGNLTDTFFDNVGQLRKGTVVNAGTFRKSSGSGTSIVTDDWKLENLAGSTLEVSAGTLRFSRDANGFNNAGLAKVNTGVLQVSGGTSTGSFEVASGATLRFATRQSSPTIVHVLDGATIDNAGTLEIDGRVRFLNGAMIVGNAALSLLGDDAEISGTAPLALDAMTWNAGTLANSGITINDGGSLAINGSGLKRLANNAKLTVAGTATLAGSQSIVNLASPATPARIEIPVGGLFDLASDVGLADSPVSAGSNAGVLDVDGTFRKSGGSGVSDVSIDWTVENNGAIEVNSGTLRFFGNVAHQGVVEVDGGNVEFRGNVSGAGEFAGTGRTTFHRDYRPGAGPLQVEFPGDMAFESTAANLYVELGGTTAGTQHDQLLVDGSAALAGSLRVSLINTGSGTFAPQAGNMFEILRADGGITGQFTAMLPPLAPNLVWQVLKSETTLSLAVASTINSVAGDYNVNGIVDIADYTVWRDSFGHSGPALAADGNSDDTVDDLDYTVWKTNFGEMSPNGAASFADLASKVPEGSLVSLLLPTAWCIPRRRARRGMHKNARKLIGASRTLLILRYAADHAICARALYSSSILFAVFTRSSRILHTRLRYSSNTNDRDGDRRRGIGRVSLFGCRRRFCSFKFRSSLLSRRREPNP